MIEDRIQSVIEEAIGDALAMAPGSVAAVDPDAPLDAVTIDDIDLDSLDLLLIIVELEHRFACEIEVQTPDGAVHATWSDFLKYIARSIQESATDAPGA